MMLMKQRVEFLSPLDALIEITKRLGRFEDRYQMSSVEFFDRYNRGEISDDREMVEWAIDYRQFLGLRQEIEHLVHDAA